MDVLVRRIEIIPHDNADSLELAKVDDYICVVLKGQFQTGDLAVYIPEQAVVPQVVLAHMGLSGALHGADKNIVKAKKLRGVLSQGLLLNLIQPTESAPAMLYANTIVEFDTEADVFVYEGDDVMDRLGIAKHESIAPWQRPALASNNVRLPECFVYSYDIDNIKKWNNVFSEHDDVVITEKIHGTFMSVCALPPRLGGGVWVTSKGLQSRGVGLNIEDTHNAYVKMAMDQRYSLGNAAAQFATEHDSPVQFFGELYGRGIQDLGYGQELPDYRLFDVRVGYLFMGYYELRCLAFRFGLPLVPELYVGKFNRQLVAELTVGKELVSGTETHLREGVVVKSTRNVFHHHLGRMILKSVSEAYLLRKNGTEYA